MFAENRKISLRQLQVLLLLDTFGTALLFLPAELAQISGRGCWVAALSGGIVIILFSCLLTGACRRMQGRTAADWFRICFGNIGGTALLAGLGGKLLLDGMLELRIFSEVICRAMLPTTPVWGISLMILLVAVSLSLQGMECRGRTAEILFFIVMIPLVIVLLAVAISSEYGRVLPLELPSFSESGRWIAAMSIIFQGMTFLYFVLPSLEQSEKTVSAVAGASIFALCIVTVIVFLCLAVYGEGVLAGKLLPALQMMERVSFTGVFLTRQDVLLLWFWMASVVIFLSGILHFGPQLGRFFQRQAEMKQMTWFWAAGIFAISFLPENLAQAYHWRMMISPWLNLLYLGIVPIFLFLKGGRKDG